MLSVTLSVVYARCFRLLFFCFWNFVVLVVVVCFKTGFPVHFQCLPFFGLVMFSVTWHFVRFDYNFGGYLLDALSTFFIVDDVDVNADTILACAFDLSVLVWCGACFLWLKVKTDVNQVFGVVTHIYRWLCLLEFDMHFQ